MFDLAVLERVVATPSFLGDFAQVRQGLALDRVGQAGLFDIDFDARLSYMVESVLASAPHWEPNKSATEICRVAAEAAELLSLRSASDHAKRRFRVRAALLYELADFPAIAAVVLDKHDFSRPLTELFSRSGAFGQLIPIGESPSINIGEPEISSLVESALFSDIRSLAAYEQGISNSVDDRACDLLASLSKDFALENTASEIAAWKSVLKKRASAAVRQYVSLSLVEQLRAMHFPPELWSSQVTAIAGGLLDSRFDAWGLASPTGTGKTFITRLLITDTLSNQPDSVVLYLVPSRALVYEISTKLGEALRPLNFDVTAVTPQLVALDDEESQSLADSSVLVLTPEKADLILRLGADVLSRVSLIIVDEAHHIESATRGALLEMYLWRIKRKLQGNGRFVFLSAVAPNIKDVVGWLGSNPGSTVIEQRATRMRIGVYRIQGTGKKAVGKIEYSDGTAVNLIPEGVERLKGRGLIQLAASLGRAGPLLIVAKGKKECERLAKEMHDWLVAKHINDGLSDDLLHSDTVQRLDARLEREMYPEVTLRTLVASRIAYHHAGLPPSVRIGLEDAIRNELVDYVFATTTLAEGVNFPFSTVIVQSLALREAPEKGRPTRYHPVTPRIFWNIAGRAGRPGHDKEGQVLLFEPTLGLDKIAYVLGDYMNPQLSSINPVRSALADSICEIQEAIESKDLSSSDIESIRLPSRASKRVQGAINLLRVSLLHARASQF